MINCNQVTAEQEFSLRMCPSGTHAISMDTFLHKAHGKDRQRVVSAVFDRVREDNMTTPPSPTFLHDAIERKDLEHVIAFLGNGTDLSVLDKDGKTPLMIACDNGLVSYVSLLIRYGALTTVAIRSRTNATALDYAINYAIHEQSTGVVKLLIREGVGCYLSFSDQVPVTGHVASSRIEMLASLLDPVALREVVLQANWTQLKTSSSTFLQRKFRQCLGKQDTASVTSLSDHGQLIKRPVTIVSDFCATGVLLTNGKVLKLHNIDPEALCQSVGQSQQRCYQLSIYQFSNKGFLQIANESQWLVRGFYPSNAFTIKLYPFQPAPQTSCEVIDDRAYKFAAIGQNKPKRTFYLPRDQGEAAWEYINALTNMCGEETQQPQCRYDPFYDNCENFVQNVSEIAGLHGRFTDYFLEERWQPTKSSLYIPLFNSYISTYTVIVATVLTMIGMHCINRIGLYFSPLRRVE